MLAVGVLLLLTCSDVTTQFVCNDVCADNNTCCDSGLGFYTCCPYQNGTCCTDRVSCCPGGYMCTSPHTCTSRISQHRHKSSSVGLPVLKRRPLMTPEKSEATPDTVFTKEDKTSDVGKQQKPNLKPTNTYGPSPEVIKLKGDHSPKENPTYSDKLLRVPGSVKPKGDNSREQRYPDEDSTVNVDDVICGTAVCVSNYTCCDWDSGPGCCQYTNGACCPGNYCCPRGYICDHGDTMYLCNIPTNSNIQDGRNKHQVSEGRGKDIRGTNGKWLEGLLFNKQNMKNTKFLPDMFLKDFSAEGVGWLFARKKRKRI